MLTLLSSTQKFILIIINVKIIILTFIMTVLSNWEQPLSIAIFDSKLSAQVT